MYITEGITITLNDTEAKVLYRFVNDTVQDYWLKDGDVLYPATSPQAVFVELVRKLEATGRVR